jgi:hypothetical protein
MYLDGTCKKVKIFPFEFRIADFQGVVGDCYVFVTAKLSTILLACKNMLK